MTNRPDPEDRMWSQAVELLAEAERLHRQFFRLAAVETAPAWEPPKEACKTAGRALPRVQSRQ